MIKHKTYGIGPNHRIYRAKPLKHALKRSEIPLRAKKKRKTTQDTTPKTWGLARADNEFRKFMLKEVPKTTGVVICVFPGCQIRDPKKLTVSHYFGRVNKGTRFDVQNCIFLCRNHHYWDKRIGWEFQKQRKEDSRAPWDGRYTIYMKETLGETEFGALESRSQLKIGPKAAIKQFQESLINASTTAPKEGI